MYLADEDYTEPDWANMSVHEMQQWRGYTMPAKHKIIQQSPHKLVPFLDVSANEGWSVVTMTQDSNGLLTVLLRKPGSVRFRRVEENKVSWFRRLFSGRKEPAPRTQKDS